MKKRFIIYVQRPVDGDMEAYIASGSSTEDAEAKFWRYLLASHDKADEEFLRSDYVVDDIVADDEEGDVSFVMSTADYR